jgi:hypothetical protein
MHRGNGLTIRLEIEAMRDRVEGPVLDGADRLVGEAHVAPHGVGRLEGLAVVALAQDVNVEGNQVGLEAVTRGEDVLGFDHRSSSPPKRLVIRLITSSTTHSPKISMNYTSPKWR